MKKNKMFFKSIIITLVFNALLYFLIKLGLHDYHVLKSFAEVPFVKCFVYFYDSWYPFIVLIAFFVYKHDNENYKKLIFSMLFCIVMAHLIFVIYPTIIERPDIEVKSITDLLIFITYKTDTPAVNCLPSVHCIFCFIVSYYTLTSNNIKSSSKFIVALYSILIVLSTIFIRQHIVEDIIAALICTGIAIFLTSVLYKNLKTTFKFLFQ